ARAWFEENWDPDISLREWWARLADSGFGVPTWPADWFGRDLTAEQAAVVHEERQKVGAPGAPGGLGVMLAGPTLIAHAGQAVKERYLRTLVNGETAWCQLVSEP